MVDGENKEKIVLDEPFSCIQFSWQNKWGFHAPELFSHGCSLRTADAHQDWP